MVMEFVEEKAVYRADTVKRESKGWRTKRPESEFINGEGDDRAKGYKWSFIKKFEFKDKKGE